jgi:structural maintenance of chromosomes protein 5
VIRRVIKFEGNKSTFSIDGVDVNRTKVLKLAQKLSIQIDNLCQFLPQDKVSEFAALTPVELLASTQRAAAGPQMTEWHNNLNRLRAEQKKLLSENKSDRDLLTNLENRQELQRADVERIQERAKIKRRIEMLEFYRPVAAYSDDRKRHAEIREQKQEVERQYKELEAELAPALQAVNEKKDYFTRTDKVVEYKRHKLTRAENTTKEVSRRMDMHEESLKNLTSQIESEKKTGKNYKQDMSKIQQAINRITRQMEEKPQEFDINSYNDRIVSSIKGTFMCIMAYPHY